MIGEKPKTWKRQSGIMSSLENNTAGRSTHASFKEPSSRNIWTRKTTVHRKRGIVETSDSSSNTSKKIRMNEKNDGNKDEELEMPDVQRAFDNSVATFISEEEGTGSEEWAEPVDGDRCYTALFIP